MRSVIKISWLGLAALVLVGVSLPRVARSETTYFTTRALLTEFFPNSEKVTYRTFDLDAATKARLSQRLGYQPAKDRYTVFVAITQGKVDGYALIDDQMGQHQPITFATRLSARGVVERLEIMIYRETRGDEVRDVRFRRQFQGKTAQDPLRVGHDVDAVSGATISSASMAFGVRRAAVLVEELVMGLGAVASAPTPPSDSAHNGARTAPR